MAASRPSIAGDFRVERDRLAGRFTSVLPLFVAITVAVLMRLPGLWLPLERDEGAYGAIAAMWLKGALPYRDVFDHKPPLIYLLYMPALIGGVQDAFPVRLWASLLFILQLPMALVIARRVWDPASAGLATVIYAVAGSAFGLQGLMLNTEQALMLPALVALWALISAIGSNATRWPVIFGLAVGLMTLIKPNATPLLLPLLLLAPVGVRSHMRNLLVAMLGVVALWLPVLAWWSIAGALEALVFALITYNQLYTIESLERWTASGLVDVLASAGPLLVCAVGGIALAGWRGVKQRQRTAVVLWTAAFFAGALLGLRPYVHYYYPTLAGLALLAAPPVVWLARRQPNARGAWRRLTALLAPALLLMVLVVPYILDNSRLVGVSPGEQAEMLYGPDGKSYFAPAQSVAAYIRRATDPDERIHVWASEPELYLLADRPAATRYIHTYPLELVPGASAEFLDELRRNPPRLLVLYRDARPAGFAAFASAHGFRVATTIAGYDIWIAADASVN